MQILRSHFLAAVLGLITSSTAFSQTIPSSATQDQSSQTPSTAPTDAAVQAATAAPDYSKEAFIIEKLYENYRFENDGTGRKDAVLRVHVLSESGVKGFGQLRFGYNSANDRMEIAYVKVIKSDGSVVTAGADAVQDLSGAVQQVAPVYTDYREKHVTVPGLRPGDILECEVITTFQTPLAAGEFWTQHDFNQTSVVLDEQLVIDIPADRAVKLKTKPGLDPKISEEKGRRIYRWTSSHLTPATDSKEKNKDKPKRKRKADEVPDVQITTFKSWEEVGRWYAALEKDRRVPSAEVRGKSMELTKGLTTDLDKTQALYDFVSQNFRYVSLSLGLARYQPQTAADVLRNQYGDCKDKNTLLAALLEAQGLHSSSVLINSYRKLDPDVPSPSQFNHVITMVPEGNQEIWLDATPEVAPFRLLSYGLRRKQALVIPASGTPHLEETPADPPMPDTQLETVNGKIDDSGKLDANITFTLRGDAELPMRMVFRSVASAKWQTLVEGMNKALGGEVSEVKVSDPAATREPFVIAYHVSKASFVDWSKKKSNLKLPLAEINTVAISADVGEDKADDKDDSSSEPFKLGPPNEHTYQVKLELASRYHVTPPVPVTLQRDYGEYQSDYKLDGSVFTGERKLILRSGELPPARADDYRAFRRTILADGAQLLAIETTVAEAGTLPSGMSNADLLSKGREATKNGNYALAIELFNRVVEADPKHKRAWDLLGLAYFDDDQDALAQNAFEKQIEVSPFDGSAFNNLGRVYLRRRDYENADKWFRKQIEIQPLDKYAHGNLGISLLDQHQYEDAVAELEKAASITPENAAPQMNLGKAYLGLHQDDKALAAFDKALSISATPLIWNEIAYELALKKVHLDRARVYAESAVSSTSAALRNIALDQVNRRDPLNSAAMASYWDTLGWVSFAEGKLDVSERYVSSAWQLSGSAEEADHLGQIYELRGNKQEATHFYALAMNARRPPPETRGRLAALVGENKTADAIEKYRNEQQRSRTLRLSNTAKDEGRADFFVLLSPGRGPDASVEGVSFVNGDEKLKAMADALRNAKFSQAFPDDSPVKLLRRGTLSCKPDSDCEFLLAIPSEVKSID